MNFNVRNYNTDWGIIHIYSNDDDSIGFAIYTYNDDKHTLYFSSLHVDNPNRKQGHGNYILNLISNYARNNNYKQIILSVKKNSWMMRWYERNGFEYIEDCREDYYQGFAWMRKEITMTLD